MKEHFDARGHKTLSYMDLKKEIQDKKSLRILQGHMLFQVVVTPCVEIRVYKGHQCTFEISKYGCGMKQYEILDLTERRLQALRRLYKDAESRGWAKEDGLFFVAFRRTARVSVSSGRL